MRKLSYMAIAVLAVGSFSLVGCGSSSSGGSSSGNGTGASTEAGTGGATGTAGDASVDGGTTSAEETRATGPIVDLRVDSNRDGLIDITGDTDEVGEDTWDATMGAVFLANIDDDQSACPTEGSDIDLPTCHDAADEIVNGEVDLVDIARLRVLAWPDAPDDAVGQIMISSPGSGYVRMFMKMLENNPLAWMAMDNANAVIENGHIRKGVELGIEAKDILRSGNWDGYIDITLTVTSGGFTVGTDTVRMRLSPVMTFHHMLPAETVYATAFNYPSSMNFRAGLKEAINLAGLANPLYEMSVPDQWTQDFFETGYMLCYL